jgi:outer membrane protein OmpA-like peptidoglycan-associated protein
MILNVGARSSGQHLRRNKMRNLVTIVLIAAIAAASPAMAANPSKEENIGVGSGVVIGALAGGPIGAIIGAAIGAKVGDTMHKKGETIDNLSGSLDDSRSDVALLESDIRALNRDIDSLSEELTHFEDIDRPQLINLMQAGIAMDLLFRTDEYVLADTTGSRLAELGSAVAQMKDVRVQLDGFADERGDEEYNLELSAKRVEFVRDQLVAAGIHPSRIHVTAHGEAPAQDDSVDSYALERRVALKIFIDRGESVATNRN